MIDAIFDKFLFMKVFISMRHDLVDETASIYLFLLDLSYGSIFASVNVVQLLFFYFT